MNPGDEIVVDNPFESYEVAVTYNFALPDGHSYGAGSTYEINIPDVFDVLPNPESNELKAADGTVFGTFIVTNDRKIMITFNEYRKSIRYQRVYYVVLLFRFTI